MATRRISRRRLKKYAIGDMRERIVVHTRTLNPPPYGSASFSELYDTGTPDWACVTTTDFAYGAGKALFDNVNIAPGTTHIFATRFDENYTAQNVIAWLGDYYKVLNTADPDGRSEYIEFQTRLMGDDDYAANQ